MAVHEICPVSTWLAELLSKKIVIDEREGDINGHCRTHLLLTICSSPVSVMRNLLQH